MRSKRYYRKEATANGYRSKFELEVANWLEENKVKFTYEPCKVKYIVPESEHSYTPDWQVNDDTVIFWESKGRLTAADRKKLIHIKASNPNLTIRILLQNSTVKITKKSKTSYADWCEKNGFEWCDWRDKKKLKGWIKK